MTTIDIGENSIEFFGHCRSARMCKIVSVVFRFFLKNFEEIRFTSEVIPHNYFKMETDNEDHFRVMKKVITQVVADMPSGARLGSISYTPKNPSHKKTYKEFVRD